MAIVGCEDSTAPPVDEPGVEGEPLAEARFLIEHNATDADSGFQLFVDSEGWDRLTVEGPDGAVVDVQALGNMEGFGLTEGFFETHEPPNDEVPLDDVLSLFPEGDYEFEAVASLDGTLMRRTARLTHTIPAAAEILTPAEGAVVEPNNLVISWNPVIRSITGDDLTLVGYQIIVAKDVDLPPQDSFFRSEMSLFLPPSTTSVGVPREFLEAATAYEIEVLAIEESGNQTISIRTFETRE
jgi:hypothetical protein